MGQGEEFLGELLSVPHPKGWDGTCGPRLGEVAWGVGGVKVGELQGAFVCSSETLALSVGAGWVRACVWENSGHGMVGEGWRRQGPGRQQYG